MVSFLIGLLIVAGVIAIFFVVLNAIPGLPPVVKTVIWIVLLIVFLVWLLSAVGGGFGIGHHVLVQ